MSLPTESRDVTNVRHHRVSKDAQIGDVRDHFAASDVPLRVPAHIFQSLVKGFHISPIVVLEGSVSIIVVHSDVSSHAVPTPLPAFVIRITLHMA